MNTPAWSAPHNGLIGDASAIAGAGQINQFLGTHPATVIYPGTRILLPELMYSPSSSNPWNTPLLDVDVDQPFTMSGTSIGRVQVPVLPVGGGADLLVSLCTDASGNPGTVIAQTRIPASWINNLSAVTGAVGETDATPILNLTGSPLAAPQFHIWGFSNEVLGTFGYPALTFVGVTANPSTAWYNGYIVVIGGVSNSNALTGVYTFPFNASGTLSPTVPQPTFPNPNDGSSATVVAVDATTGDAVVVNTGGGTSFGGTPTTNVYISTLNTATGQMSAWAAQSVLPSAVQSHGMATSGGYVYCVGGINASGAAVTAVNYAQVQNAQITGWTATTPLPVATQLPLVVAANGYLVVAGGADASLNAYTTVHYAAIQSDGALGPWVPGPPLYAGTYNANANPFANDYGIIMIENTNSITFSATGPSLEWNQNIHGGSGELPGYWDLGNGQVVECALTPSLSEYGAVTWNLMPYISVPLPASGLTNGATYHVLLQQQGGDPNDYLSTAVTEAAYTGTGPTALTSARGAYVWTAQSAGYGVPIQAFSNTVAAATLPLHLWADNGARVTTIVSATTPDQRVLGVCEATRQSAAANTNQGFQAGIAPWTVTGGTVAQSATQSFEGGYAAQVTPSGSATSVYLQSEMLSCMPGQSVTAEGRMWFTNTVTSNASMSVNWYTLAGVYVSTSSNNVSVAAATWTDLANAFTAPATAYQYTINATLSGTPAAGQVFYVDLARGYPTYVGPQSSTVAQITADATWPAPWAGTGVAQLA